MNLMIMMIATSMTSSCKRRSRPWRRIKILTMCRIKEVTKEVEEELKEEEGEEEDEEGEVEDNEMSPTQVPPEMIPHKVPPTQLPYKVPPTQLPHNKMALAEEEEGEVKDRCHDQEEEVRHR